MPTALPISIFNPDIYKVVLSLPTKTSTYTRIEILSNGRAFQASQFTKKQVFHKNLQNHELQPFIEENLGIDFLQYTAWDSTHEHSAKVTKKGKLLTTSKVAKAADTPNFKKGTFDKQKNHILNEGDHIPALHDMGVFTKDNKIIKGMHDKFHQINRFIELIADETKKISPNTIINVVDFGCGKSYLTFLLYHYFTVIEGRKVNICGLDLNKDLVQKCSATAQKYEYNRLEFKLGDIQNQAEPPLSYWNNEDTFNIVISLHACNTATDHALYNGVKWKANLICAVPCCQHELRHQMKPQSFDILQDYGIIKERFASIATDAIRAKLLEYVGYHTQIIEFTDMEHTAKNLMIRASYGKCNPHALESVQKLVREFSFEPTLVKLLGLSVF